VLSAILSSNNLKTNEIMKDQKLIIETVGTVQKREDLVFFDNPKNILAFETAHAYPGYNGIVPQNYNPNSVFLITKEQYLTEEIFIHSQNIRNKVDFTFNSAVAHIEYQNKKFPGIRIKDIANYSFIPELINAYSEEGIQFEKRKGVEKLNTLIQVKKEFYLEPKEKDCYKDLADEQMYYFEIPKHMKWDEFEKVTMDVKYNNPTLNFDAASTLFYRAKKVVFAVRIYKENLNMEELEKLQEQFLKKIS
jgi:hypothetical protein